MSRVEAKTEDLLKVTERADRMADSSLSITRGEARENAKHAVRKENELMWAYYRTTDQTQREIAETVIHDRDQRPTQSQISRIVRELDEEIPFTEIESLDGWQPFVEEDRGYVTDERVELMRDHIARLLVVEDMSARLTSPETDVADDDAPEWMKPLEFDALEVKRRESRRDNQATAPPGLGEPVTNPTGSDD